MHQITELLRAQEGRQIERHNEIISRLRRLERKEDTMSAALDTLTQDVTDTETVEESAITLIEGLAAQITAAGTDPTKLAALSATLEAEKAKLAAAITANTPAAS